MLSRVSAYFRVLRTPNQDGSVAKRPRDVSYEKEAERGAATADPANSSSSSKVAKGDVVEVSQTFTSDDEYHAVLSMGLLGTVAEIDQDGDARVLFDGHQRYTWVCQDLFVNLKVKEKAPVCCDRCDGPHETVKCLHFSKPRGEHADAWANLGKAVRTDDSENAPVVRNAKVFQQPADGSCLFHSLSFGLSDQSTAQSLRSDIARFITNNPDMLIADSALKEWIKRDTGATPSSYAARTAGNQWGGGIEMAALTRLKQVNVHVYEKCRHVEGYRRISAFDYPGASKTVGVLYQGRMHYDAIVI